MDARSTLGSPTRSDSDRDPAHGARQPCTTHAPSRFAAGRVHAEGVRTDPAHLRGQCAAAPGDVPAGDRPADRGVAAELRPDRRPRVRRRAAGRAGGRGHLQPPARPVLASLPGARRGRPGVQPRQRAADACHRAPHAGRHRAARRFTRPVGRDPLRLLAALRPPRRPAHRGLRLRADRAGKHRSRAGSRARTRTARAADGRGTPAGAAGADRAALPVQHAGHRASPVPHHAGGGSRHARQPDALPQRRPAADARGDVDARAGRWTSPSPTSPCRSCAWADA